MPEYDTTVPAGHGDAGTVTGDPGGTDVGGAGEDASTRESSSRPRVWS